MDGKLLHWLLMLLYGAIVYHCLRDASPVWMDGGGPMPSFFSDNMPVPELGEYYRRQAYYDLLYAIPYATAALVITAAACGVAPRLLCRPHDLRSVCAATLLLVLLLAVGSDIGSHLRWWNGPLFLLYPEFGLYDLVMLAKLIMPISLLAGAVAATKAVIR
jgi:hypothetical protein